MAGETENPSAKEPTNGKTASDQDQGPDEAGCCCELEDLVTRVEEEARAVFQQVRRGVEDALEVVKRNPGKSLAAALLIGMFFGRITRR